MIFKKGQTVYFFWEEEIYKGKIVEVSQIAGYLTQIVYQIEWDNDLFWLTEKGIFKNIKEARKVLKETLIKILETTRVEFIELKDYIKSLNLKIKNLE